MKRNWTEILENSYQKEVLFGDTSGPLVYLGDFIFDFTTYDDEMTTLFAQKALEVCEAVTDGKTFEYIEDPERYQWYLLMCNMPFFNTRLEWGGSIRGAWWDYNKITYSSCGLWDGDVQMDQDLEFEKAEWEDFIRAVCDFARKVREPLTAVVE
jgi:hypothetical protein